MAAQTSIGHDAASAASLSAQLVRPHRGPLRSPAAIRLEPQDRKRTGRKLMLEFAGNIFQAARSGSVPPRVVERLRGRAVFRGERDRSEERRVGKEWRS